MKALALKKYGQPLAWINAPVPTPADGEVVVRVHAASLNPLDAMIQRGEIKALYRHKPNQIMGNDLAGVITAIGEGVTSFAIGDEVYARPAIQRLGAFAEYAALGVEDVAPKPRNLTMAEAASLPLVSLTALQAFTEKTRVGPGTTVFIQGGAGGLGSAAIQVATMLGATVATTVGTKDVALARTLGADIVVDYRTQRYEDFVADCDVVLDTLGGTEIERSMGVLKPGGTLVSVIGNPDTELATQIGRPYMKPVMALLSRKERAAAKRHGVSYKFLFMRADGAQLGRITQAVESGALTPLVGRVFPFAELAEELSPLGTKKAGPGKTVAQMVAPGA
ncbi:NADP-dependent oxidoreductase [Corynebacterium sp. zg-331]|uniref:NADP-dependent oxidoreductase n=1 Tax=unclassified Corynebacterium TaxID=2624378 RepID=UPI00128BD2A1|nr:MULTISPECIES: NADP-dependent oxidoreductase [unclassified Corynebacterium]MBC3185820.1 NADP-dependent oxidoreductase [Corynebacterium sp. zg-331]MPV52312.1 zinc-binding dehydrogenase [Corynebacterium sp. zg331]